MDTVRTRRWSRGEYDCLIDKGVFPPGERLELVGGELVVREPQRALHATAIELALDALKEAFGPGWRVRIQLPVALDDESEPEPDVAVAPGGARDYLPSHPAQPALIVEVADTTLAFDRVAEGESLRPGPNCRLLDGQLGGSGTRGLSETRARARGRARLALHLGGHAPDRRPCFAAGRAPRPHQHRRPAAVASPLSREGCALPARGRA